MQEDPDTGADDKGEGEGEGEVLGKNEDDSEVETRGVEEVENQAGENNEAITVTHHNWFSHAPVNALLLQKNH